MSRRAAWALAGWAATAWSASAADLALRGATLPYEPPPVVEFDWSGFYAGVNLGYGSSLNRHTTSCVNPAGTVGGAGCPILPGLDTDRDGIVGGGQVGYNLRLRDTIVVGLEADIQYADVGGSAGTAGTFPTVGGAPVAVAGFDASQRLDYLGTVRLRAGYGFDRLLVYGTGGLAYGDVVRRQSLVLAGAGAPSFVESRRSTEIGWAAGAGLEYAFTDAITGRVEALYYDLGSTTLSGPSAPATGFTRGARFDTAGVIVRAGLNYRFAAF